MVILLALLTSSFPSFAINCRDFQPEIPLDEVIRLSANVGKVLEEEDKLLGCTWEQQIKYYGAIKRNAERVDQLLKQVEGYDTSKLSKENKSQVRKAKRTLKCIKNRQIDDMAIRCVSEGGECKKTLFDRTLAYVIGYESELLGLIKIKKYPNKEVNICNKEVDDLPEQYVDGMMLHELSHHCKTEDLHYFVEPHNYFQPASYLQGPNWAKNADQYAYWFHHGFCVPGVDCEWIYKKTEKENLNIKIRSPFTTMEHKQ